MAGHEAKGLVLTSATKLDRDKADKQDDQANPYPTSHRAAFRFGLLGNITALYFVFVTGRSNGRGV